jgi:uncharacterized membrane protein
MNPQDTLTIIRSNSCYQTLRGFVNAICVLGIIAPIFSIVGFIYENFTGGITPWSFVWLLASIIALLFVFAMRQAMFLLIDIADAQIQSHQESQATPQLLRQLLRAYQVEPEA